MKNDQQYMFTNLPIYTKGQKRYAGFWGEIVAEGRTIDKACDTFHEMIKNKLHGAQSWEVEKFFNKLTSNEQNAGNLCFSYKVKLFKHS